MRRKKGEVSDRKVLSASFRTGVIALVFLVLGYQVALFVHKAAVTKIISNRDDPDTVYIIDRAQAARLVADGAGNETGAGSEMDTEWSGTGGPGQDSGGNVVVRRYATHSDNAKTVREQYPRRTVETFRFNPNTVSVEDLQRLGFSPRQAESIDNYRKKGGRFRRKSDFAKSYVVDDTVYERLKPFIDIPLVNLNTADSAALDDLPGIGGYFASKIIQHRQELGGYSSKEQLMDIYHFDVEKFNGLKDLVYVPASSVRPFRLWTLPADSLKMHPYIRNWQTAHAIVLYRENNPREAWTVDALAEAGIISQDQAVKLKRLKLE